MGVAFFEVPAGRSEVRAGVTGEGSCLGDELIVCKREKAEHEMRIQIFPPRVPGLVFGLSDSGFQRVTRCVLTFTGLLAALD